MTRSELHTILTAGMATVASNVLGLYVMILQGQFPTIAGHLVSASVLSAPAALVISKILLPEGAVPETLGRTVAPKQEAYANIMEAMISGANAGLRLCVGIAALLLAFLGMVALLDLILAVLGSWVNQLFGLQMTWSFRELLGYLFYPFVIAMGIPLEDAGAIAALLGGRVVMTEIPSYQGLARLVADGALVHPRSAVVASYALCGFAHVASLAIFIGGIAAIAPSRTQDLTRVGPRALVAATLACLMTGCIAGTFFSSSSILLGG
jgi:CNT family concentrative nucleoside transporter